MEYKKEIMVKDYFEIHNFYSEIYGYDRTIIVMQVGSFHECYSTDAEGINLVELAQKLDVVCTRKNSKEPVSKSNPRMLGFPVLVTDNFIEKLINLNYTVVKIDQTSEPPRPKREVVGIYSPATYIDKQINNNKSNYLVSLVIDKIKGNNICIGIGSYDLSTGYGGFYETYSKSTDLMIGLDDTIRYLETCPPKEVILQHVLEEEEKINGMTITDIIGYLNLDNKNLYIYNQSKNTKLSYQKVIFENIFVNIPNIFEYLNLHLYNWARLALTNLYDYVNNHQPNLLTKIKLPVEFDNKKYLYLGNHSLNQLNIINESGSDKSLFNIINNTKTTLGKRYLHESLSKPLIDKDILNERYNLIEKIITNNNSICIASFLEDISDIERLIRKIELNTLHPYELYLLYISLYQIDKLVIYCQENNLFNIDNNHNLNDILRYIENTFELNLINSLNFTNFNDYDNNIYKLSVYPELDNVLEDINSSINFIDNLVNVLSTYVDDKKVFVKKEENSMITIKYNEREGHYLYITNRRCEILKKNLEKVKYLDIGKYKLTISELEFSELPKSSYTKINCKKIKEISNEIVIYKTKMAKLIKEKFKLQLNYINNTFNNILCYWGKMIGYIDFINSGAITAIKNHYIKPLINHQEISYFEAENMRHPIVEYISKDYEYKPHNLSLGQDLCGILLYGINSSGKSTLMKSIGINIVLAQIGYFVACSNFIYSPYHSLFTRISGNDNLYKGLSSFLVELMEITAILKRNNYNTLVIADEIARGTEITSANVIVTYMLKTLSESNTSFITATHLHELVTLPTVKQLTNVKAKHLKLTYDDENDCLIYNRELLDGNGESFYGLQVAKYLMKDKKFNDITTEILKEYNNSSIKESKYNSSNYMIECYICKSKTNLESHHIEFQKNFKEDYHKDKFHYYKNANYNLVTLCRTCHDDVDRNKIKINGWIETSNGKELNYTIENDSEKLSKYDKSFIKYIKLLQNDLTDPKIARIKIKETYDKKVSTKTILNIWNNNI
jgi:DNA mismatch repair protein MutS